MALSQHSSPLPQPRRSPLKPGGQRESELIGYLDQGVNRIQKRVDNRLTKRKTKPAPGESLGYRAFWEAAIDLEGLLDVVWVSASPNLQLPYLLNIAILTAEFLPVFDVSSRSTHATFRLLLKLDFAFSSLLTGHDATTGDCLPGFEHGRSVSTTDKVRLKGIVTRTRLTVARVISRESMAGSDDTDEPVTPDPEKEVSILAGVRQDTVAFEGFGTNHDDEDNPGWEERNVASVYKRTMEELGDVLGGTPMSMGVVTDDWPANRTE